MKKLKFSKVANTKLKKIKEWIDIENPKVYSFSLLSGYSCPMASDCQTYAVTDKKSGKRKVVDGKNAKFRCFSAIQEAQYNETYDQRKHNFDLLLARRNSYMDMTELLLESIPTNADIIRVHVGGDFFSSDYMLAWYLTAQLNPSIKFYAYTKSIKWQLENEIHRPNNFSMIASYGGKEDSWIDEHNIKSANVVFHPSETNLPIDDNEYYAINDKGSFSLLLHGTQKQGSKGSEALKRMNKENIKYSYSKN